MKKKARLTSRASQAAGDEDGRHTIDHDQRGTARSAALAHESWLASFRLRPGVTMLHTAAEAPPLLALPERCFVAAGPRMAPRSPLPQPPSVP